MELLADEQPVAIGLWRNLCGWAGDGSRPYRSIGVEPMIGHNPAREQAAENDLGNRRYGWTGDVVAADLTGCQLMQLSYFMPGGSSPAQKEEQ